MNDHRLVLSILSFLALILAACGGVSEPQLDSVTAPSGSTGAETPPSTVAPKAPETATADQSGTNGSEALSPTTVPTTIAATTDFSGGLTSVPQELITQALNSPEVISCLSSELGMLTLMEMASRGPTNEEIALMLPCLDALLEVVEDLDDGASISAQWQTRIDAALAPTSCETSSP